MSRKRKDFSQTSISLLTVNHHKSEANILELIKRQIEEEERLQQINDILQDFLWEIEMEKIKKERERIFFGGDDFKAITPVPEEE